MKARYWILTIPHAEFTPFKHESVQCIRGQLERGRESGYLHWQLLASFAKQTSLKNVKSIYGERAHAEPTRSSAAEEYVWKADTYVEGTRFQLGEKAICRNNSRDWERIRQNAKDGRLGDIPADIFVRNYNQLRRIATDNLRAVGVERAVHVFWGPTGVGKSHRAWERAGLEAYPKDPNTKFWDGYRDHEKVVIDEFRGRIDISHMLRWTDKYPVIVEIKGSATVLRAREIYITSNLCPEAWYPDIDKSTLDALMRRLNVVEIINKEQVV